MASNWFLLAEIVLSIHVAEDVGCKTAIDTNVDKGVIYTPSTYPVELSMDIYYPIDYDESEKLACSVFAHGGLWQTGSNEDRTSIDFARNVVKATRTIVATIQYRLTNDTSCCSTDHQCNLGINECNGHCNGTYPDFLDDLSAAILFLSESYSKCDANNLFAFGHSAGGQMVTQYAILNEASNKINGFIGIEGIYNLSKFYAGPKGEGWTCSIEKAFSSDGLSWCDHGDPVCNPLIVNGSYHGTKGLFVHSPEDTLTLTQQAKEMVCRLNGVGESQCSCSDYYHCHCLDECLDGNDRDSNAHFTDKVVGTHFGVLSTEILANVTRDFICPLIVHRDKQDLR